MVDNRRLAQARKRLKRERERAGMFADQLVGGSPHERIARQDESAMAHFQAMRDHQASMWRRGRRALDALPYFQQEELLAEWNTDSWLPGSPEYFLYFLASHGVRIPDSDERR